LLADVPVPNSSLALALLSSSVLAGVLTFLGKALDLIGSRSIARRQGSLDSSGLELRSLEIPAPGTRHILLRGVLGLMCFYFLAGTIADIVSIPLQGYSSQNLLFLGGFGGGLLLTAWILVRTWKSTTQAVGTFTTARVELRSTTSEVMERCRYALSRIGAVVVSYELDTGWIRAQRGRLGQDILVSVNTVGDSCRVSVTSAGSFQLLPGDLDFGVNHRNVRRLASILAGAARGSADVDSTTSGPA
jgi:hypothetical protein